MKRIVLCALIVIGCAGGDNNDPPPSCTTGAVFCPAGFQCSLATHDCEAASGTMRWQLVDACSDGLPIQARFFDTTHGAHWPEGPSQVFLTLSEGAFIDKLLACIPGAKICYGAEPQPTDGGYWGLGLQGSESCTDCCAICGTGNPPPINLTCI